jgi:hypothetical protein
MIVYAETNYVLELALLQESHQVCEELLQMCERKALALVLPAYSLIEPYETLVRRKKARIQLQEQLDRELRQLDRTADYKSRLQDFQDVTSLLTGSIQEEFQRLEQTRARLLHGAEIISLTPEILSEASVQRAKLDMSAQDAVVYASILQHLIASQPSHSCFVNRNRKDFDAPDIVKELGDHGCKILFNFDRGKDYALSCLGQPL